MRAPAGIGRLTAASEAELEKSVLRVTAACMILDLETGRRRSPKCRSRSSEGAAQQSARQAKFGVCC